MKKVTTRLAAAVTAFLAMSATVLAAPAMWVMRDDDTTIYLFGTVHILDQSTEWRSPAIDAAFASADRLWVEANLLTDTTLGFGTILKLGTSVDRPLAQRLSAEDHAKLADLCKRMEMSPAAVEKLQPWMAAVTLTLHAARRFGYTESGVDQSLLEAAKAEGKEILAFETLIEQIEIFASMNEETSLAMLRQTIIDLEGADVVFDELISTWESGNLEAMTRVAIEPMAAASPALLKAVLTDRNHRWTETIAARMDVPGTEFVAVGAAHLIGPDGVPALLEARGFKVERVATDAQ